MLKKSFLIAICYLAIFSNLNADWRLGMYAGANINLHSPNFNYPYTIKSRNPDIIDSANVYSPFDQSAVGLGLNIGLMANYKIDDMFTFSLRLGFNGAGATLEQQDNLLAGQPIFPNAGAFPNNFEMKREMDVSLQYLEITPAIQIYDIISKDIYLLGGLELGFGLNTSYSLSETVIPANAAVPLYDPANKVRFTDSKLQEVGARVAIALGIGWDIEISKNLYLSPELSFRLPITQVSSYKTKGEFIEVDQQNNLPRPVIKDVGFTTWDVPQIRFGLNLAFDLNGKDEEPIVENANSSVKAGFDRIITTDMDGNISDVKKITVEEVSYSELFPVVPYVFFNQNESQPSPNSQNLSSSEAGEFNIALLEQDVLSVNRNTLDIIGSRMKTKSGSQLTITGTNDGKSEAKTKELSSQRAEFAKNYLVVNYGISPDRITTKSQNLPTKPSSQTTEDGIEENRRIEFSSTDKSLLEPITLQSDKKTYASPSVVEFVPKVESTDDVTKWNLELLQSDKVVKNISGSNVPTSIKWAIQANDLASSEIPVDYYFTVENSGGAKDRARGSIPVEYLSSNRKKTEDKADRSISKYSLIVFDFDSPAVSDTDKEIILKNVLPAIKYNSIVQIYGYSDRIGSDEYNKKLATNRANNVKSILQESAKSAKYEVYGMGEDVLLVDNNLPIGRQLSRTVQIYIITPKE